MKTDQIVVAYKEDPSPLNRVADLLDEGYILIEKTYNPELSFTYFHLRKTPLTALMTILSKKV